MHWGRGVELHGYVGCEFNFERAQAVGHQLAFVVEYGTRNGRTRPRLRILQDSQDGLHPARDWFQANTFRQCYGEIKVVDDGLALKVSPSFLVDGKRSSSGLRARWGPLFPSSEYGPKYVVEEIQTLARRLADHFLLSSLKIPKVIFDTTMRKSNQINRFITRRSLKSGIAEIPLVVRFGLG